MHAKEGCTYTRYGTIRQSGILALRFWGVPGTGAAGLDDWVFWVYGLPRHSRGSLRGIPHPRRSPTPYGHTPRCYACPGKGKISGPRSVLAPPSVRGGEHSRFIPHPRRSPTPYGHTPRCYACPGRGKIPGPRSVLARPSVRGGEHLRFIPHPRRSPTPYGHTPRCYACPGRRNFRTSERACPSECPGRGALTVYPTPSQVAYSVRPHSEVLRLSTKGKNSRTSERACTSECPGRPYWRTHSATPGRKMPDNSAYGRSSAISPEA